MQGVELHQLLQKLEFPVVAVDVGFHPLIIVLVKGNEKVRLILKIFAVVLLLAEQMEGIVVHVGGVAGQAAAVAVVVVVGGKRLALLVEDGAAQFSAQLVPNDTRRSK